MQKPSAGRIVLVPVDALNVPSNGADVVPGIITRVWSDTMVNVKILLDGGDDVLGRTSVKLYDTPEDAAATAAGKDRQFAELRCYWPPRV